MTEMTEKKNQVVQDETVGKKTTHVREDGKIVTEQKMYNGRIRANVSQNPGHSRFTEE